MRASGSRESISALPTPSEPYVRVSPHTAQASAITAVERDDPAFFKGVLSLFQDARLQPFADQAHEPPSAIRCSRNRTSHSQLTVSKNARMSASNIQFTFFR